MANIELSHFSNDFRCSILDIFNCLFAGKRQHLGAITNLPSRYTVAQNDFANPGIPKFFQTYKRDEKLYSNINLLIEDLQSRIRARKENRQDVSDWRYVSFCLNADCKRFA